MGFDDEFVDPEVSVKHPEYDSTVESLDNEDALPLGKLPYLRCVNGCGLSLLGRDSFHQNSASYISTLYFKLFFMPLLPLRRFRVRPISSEFYLVSSSTTYEFLWELALTQKQRIHKRTVLMLVAALVLFEILKSKI